MEKQVFFLPKVLWKYIGAETRSTSLLCRSSRHYSLPVFEKTATHTRSGYIYLSRPLRQDPLTKCLRCLKNQIFKLTFTIDINYKRHLPTISPSFLTSLCGNWQVKRNLIDLYKSCFAKLSNENIYCKVQVSPNTFTGFLATLGPSINGLLTEGRYAV